MKLLLIDDDAFLRDMYATKFIEAGFTVEVAGQAVDGLSQLEQDSSFDVILLDMVMPGMTGLEFIEQIKTKFPDFSGQIIVLSNQGQPEDIEEATQAGAAGYIIKAEMIPSEVVQKVQSLTKQ